KKSNDSVRTWTPRVAHCRSTSVPYLSTCAGRKAISMTTTNVLPISRGSGTFTLRTLGARTCRALIHPTSIGSWWGTAPPFGYGGARGLPRIPCGGRSTTTGKKLGRNSCFCRAVKEAYDKDKHPGKTPGFQGNAYGRLLPAA